MKLKGIKVGDIVANTLHSTVGIVRVIDVKGDEFKTDADGWQFSKHIELFNAKKHTNFSIAPSTEKEIRHRYTQNRSKANYRLL